MENRVTLQEYTEAWVNLFEVNIPISKKDEKNIRQSYDKYLEQPFSIIITP